PERMLYTLEAPELSKESGFYDKEFELEIAENSEENTIYYTLDGSEPTLNSSVYEEPIHIETKDDNTMTVVRAKILSKNNTMSETITKSYFVNENVDERFDLPVFSLVTDQDNLFDEEIGIYTKGNATYRGSDWERPIHLEFFKEDGNLELTQNGGVRIHGGTSRAANQKSLRLYSKSEYDDEDRFNYSF